MESTSSPLAQSYEDLLAQLADLGVKVDPEKTACMFRKDRIGHIVWVNDEWTRFIGRRAADIIGRTDFDLFPVSLAQKYREDDWNVMRDGKPFRSFETVDGAEGKTHFVHVVKVPHRDEHGNVNGVLGAFWKSPADNQVELQLYENEARLRAILEHLPVMMAALGNRGQIVFWNHECERVTGYSTAEILSNPDALALLYPDASYRAALMQELSRGDFPKRDWDWTLTCKDGSTRTIAWNNVLDHSITGWDTWGLGIDVTERNRNREVLEAIQLIQNKYIAKASTPELFQLLLCQLLVLTRSQFGILGEILKTPSDEPFLKAYISSVDSEAGAPIALAGPLAQAVDLRDPSTLVGNVVATGEPLIVNDCGAELRPSGFPEALPHSRAFLGVPLFHDRQLIGVAAVANRPGAYPQDVVDSLAPFLATCATLIHSFRLDRQHQRQEEERRRLESQLQYAQKLESLGVLAGGVAHDFNNLLVSILGHASLAGEDLSLASPARESIRQIETAAMRAADLCKQMLAYSGKGRFIVRFINVSELVEEMTHLLQISLSKKIVLRFNLMRDLPAIEADATQIRQVLMNLITNASEACGEKSGVLTISTGVMNVDREYLATTFFDVGLTEGRYVYVEISDTGCGMDEETQAKIYDPFFTTKAMGRGLGMAAVLGIVRGHRGAIKCYSEVGRGTTFKMGGERLSASVRTLKRGHASRSRSAGEAGRVQGAHPACFPGTDHPERHGLDKQASDKRESIQGAGKQAGGRPTGVPPAPKVLGEGTYKTNHPTQTCSPPERPDERSSERLRERLPGQVGASCARLFSAWPSQEIESQPRDGMDITIFRPPQVINRCAQAGPTAQLDGSS